VFAVPGIALFLPSIGAVSDAFGIQASMLVLVPVSLAAGLILASAHRFLGGDIEHVWAQSVARGSDTTPAATPDGSNIS
jgi:hypothetical protein